MFRTTDQDRQHVLNLALLIRRRFTATELVASANSSYPTPFTDLGAHVFA
jgi:hypothetical protein